MIVITADRMRRGTAPGHSAAPLAGLEGDLGSRLALPADRTTGDEIQVLVDDGGDALAVSLVLTRTGQWVVGIGVGAVREPLSESVQSGAGNAFVAAQAAVDRAKKRVTGLAVVANPRTALANDVEALLDLLVVLRARRSDAGWEMRDLLSSGLTQAEAAERIGITPQSASKRARAAGIRIEDASIAPLSRLLDRLDGAVGQVAANQETLTRGGSQRPIAPAVTRSGPRGG